MTLGTAGLFLFIVLTLAALVYLTLSLWAADKRIDELEADVDVLYELEGDGLSDEEWSGWD